MQPVFGLVENDRRGLFKHLGRNLFAAMGGQTVHEKRPRTCRRHQLTVHLKCLELPPPYHGLALLPHRRPHIGVDGIRAADGRHELVAHRQRDAQPEGETEYKLYAPGVGIITEYAPDGRAVLHHCVPD